MSNIAKVKFSQLPAAEDTDIQDSDIIPLVNVDTSKKVTFANFKEYLVGNGFVLEDLLNSTVETAIENLIGGAPEYLDTLKELADAINNDGSFSNTIRDLIEESVANSFQGKTTDDLQEGSVNLYFTEGVADAHFDAKFTGKTTTHLQEGDNLYFTEQRVLDLITPLIPTDLFSGSYNDLLDQPTIPTDINQLTDEDGLLGSGGGTGELPDDAEFNSVTVDTLNVATVNFSGTGAVNITSGSDINLEADGWITFSSLPKLPNYTIAELNALAGVPTGAFAFCTDLTQPAPVYYDGAVWRDMINNDINGGPDDFSAPVV